jgi:hypothetical protein
MVLLFFLLTTIVLAHLALLHLVILLLLFLLLVFVEVLLVELTFQLSPNLFLSFVLPQFFQFLLTLIQLLVELNYGGPLVIFIFKFIN